MRDIFNPFGKGLREVKEEDLEVLKFVAEGWNVEYKREKPIYQKHSSQYPTDQTHRG